ncbi:hypothetical protein [Candidatus Parabeggiatoa sp. HSG14]|uniref:hypothetical protein n=1 Tax=Candidatus Parabeggiatoa sp. HSG14 TaxID=3055593 RepID=UPI0025A7CA28|nr:hypothetical protein [Thiotrichales bacterium HSG14]
MIETTNSNSKEHLTHGVCQERVQRLANLALDVVESLLTTDETPINVRLNAAFRIFELCGTNTTDAMGKAIIQGIENNAREIEKNAHELSYLEALLKDNNSSSNKSDNLNEIKTSVDGPI